MNRIRWAARILGFELPNDRARERGLIRIEIDGLSRSQFEEAMRGGKVRHLAKMIAHGHFEIGTFYSGSPSSATAVAAASAEKSRPFSCLLISILYVPEILRMILLAVLEFLIGLAACVRGTPARIGIRIMQREFVRFRVLLEIERGVRVIHANFAHWTFYDIDRTIRDIHRACLRSDAREYETIIYSDPGMEENNGFVLLTDEISRRSTAAREDIILGRDLDRIVGDFLAADQPWIFPRPRSEENAATRTLRVMTYNIHSCVGTDGRLSPERIAAVINRLDPDIIAVQEVDAHRRRSGHHDQAQVIADHLSMHHAFHSMLGEEKEKYGIAIFSRFPLEIVKSALLTPGNRRTGKEARGAIWVRIKPGEDGQPIHFINTHFGLGREDRNQQVKELLGDTWLGGIGKGGSVIVCGDFNSGPRSVVWEKLNSEYRDAQLSLPGHTASATFPSMRPFSRLDHLFISPNFTVKKIQIPRFPAALVASDHLPLCVDLEVVSE
ncbi:MAG: endonuclease/exonuclease/phosphatase family protein [Armatimonadetes bacterium]|nr:endonuclease/exonuclease/phosphatase family protein [Akkermansiaceae bacterium]